MSCVNSCKHKIQNIIHSFLNKFAVRKSNFRALIDDQKGCMKFGICSFSPKTLEEIPYFNF